MRRPVIRFGSAALCLSLLAACSAPLAAEDGRPSASIRPPLADRFDPRLANVDDAPNFRRHVMPLLGRLGCNGRSCHGSFQGQGGFRLSMFGYDFAADHTALTAGEKPRVDRKVPAASLILNKPTSDDDHGGGQRFTKQGWEYRVLRTWIERGAKNDGADAGQLAGLEITPAEIVWPRAGLEQTLRVVARWSDGSREDVTCLARFSSNDDGVATVDATGLVAGRGKGDTHVIVCYDAAVASVPVTVPVSDRIGPRYPQVATTTPVDELVVAKLRKLGILPAERCTDEEFLRRASLDIAGSLPTPDEVLAFVADPSSDKRARKIDELLERPAYAVWWSTKLCDQTGLNAPLFLGGTEFAKTVEELWWKWMLRRVQENAPYDQIVAGIVLGTSRKPGQSYDDYVLEQSSYVRKQNQVDFAAQPWMPIFWFRENLAQPDDKALAFAYTFLCVRLECAQCHKHPFDQWSQQDFKQFAAVFERVSKGLAPDAKEAHERLKERLGVPQMKNAAERRAKYREWAEQGQAVPWLEVFVAAPKPLAPGQTPIRPKLLGGPELELGASADPREPLMTWLRSRDNPYFARSFVNRVWAHYFGRGIVHPADDFNLGNPPSNAPLLDYLASGFIEHGYDMKWLHRQITRSDAYQRSWRTNDTNRGDEKNFARALVRRMHAEVAVDAMWQATAGSSALATAHARVDGRRIGVQATADLARTEYPLAVFGKPLRTVNCDCEREQDTSLLQAIFVRNDQDLVAMLGRADGWLKTLPRDADHESLIRDAYLRALSREPRPDELARCRRHLAQASSAAEGLADVLWALLNTHEFITNH